MIYTTLKEIHTFFPYGRPWDEIFDHLRRRKIDNDPFPLVTILDIRGLHDTIWCLRACPRVAAEFAHWCAERAAILTGGPVDEVTEAAERASELADDHTPYSDRISEAADWANRAARATRWYAGDKWEAERQTAKLRELLS
jgi:hypothetical protein